MKEIAKESGHWYTADGKPSYTRTTKKGKERSTTLRDAKKENLYPSVTTILKVKAAPGIEIWKQNNILQAAATLPHIEGESVDDWCKRVIADANEQGKQAREKGTAIHGAIERHYLGEEIEFSYVSEVKAVADLIDDLGIVHTFSEKSFAHKLGYAGKVDFVGTDINGRPVVIDFKTTDFSEKKKKYHWPEMVIQLSAYSNGFNLQHARLINVFVSRNLEDPQVNFYEWSDNEITDGWRQFELLLELWQIEKGYKPE